MKTRVLIYTIEVLGPVMAGPGIRALRFAEALYGVADVRLVAAAQADLPGAQFSVFTAEGDALYEHIEWADVIVIQSPLLTVMPKLQQTDKVLVVDLYDPFLLEELQRSAFLETPASIDFTVRAVNDMVRYADFVLCASEKQRDMWIGQLSSQGRLNSLTYGADPSLRSLIDVVPFGVDSTAAVQTRHGIRGVVPGISDDDVVLLWGGGIYDWFDPLTLIRAIAILEASRSDVRLFFLATKHANPAIGTMKMADDAAELARELGVLGRSVFFNENWVAHEGRADYFLDADLGVSTHLDHLETAFSFRTRVLDYLWAGLPIVSTAGDSFEPVIRENELGVVVPPGDPQRLADELEALLGDPDRLERMRVNVKTIASDFSWERALVPFVDFCTNPRFAADRPHNVRGRVSANSSGHDLESLYASTSWRITAPLRAISRALRRS